MGHFVEYSNVANPKFFMFEKYLRVNVESAKCAEILKCLKRAVNTHCFAVIIF